MGRYRTAYKQQAQEPQQEFYYETTPEIYQELVKGGPEGFTEEELADFKTVIGRQNIGKVTKTDVFRYEMTAAQMDAGRWAEGYRLYIPSAGSYFTFKGHEYLQEPYSCTAPLQVYIKGAQMGYSVRAKVRSFHDLIYRLKTGLAYYFPTKSDVTEFSKSRFGPFIENNPLIKSMVKDTDSANIKRVGNCMLYLRGLKTAISAKSISVDKLIFDEIDEADPAMVDLATKRLDHSDIKEIEIFSTPTDCDYGVDLWFQKTDQRFRMMWCDHCMKHTTCFEEDFPECVRQTDSGVLRVCKKCQREILLGDERHEYVAKYPNKEYRGRPAVGFCAGQLHSEYVTPDEILEDYYTTKYIQDFWNSRMARAYTDAHNRMDVSHVIGLCGSHGIENRSAVPTCIGIDVGPVKHHVVIGRKEYGGSIRIIWIGETDWNGLDDLMKRYNGYAIQDGLPEPNKSAAWVKKWPYRAWSCFYSKSPKTGKMWNDDEKKITVYQSMAMDSSHAMLQEGKVILPRKSDVIDTFAKHCHNVARKKIEDEETGSIYNKWVKLGEDHYRKAFSYMVLAMERTPESTYSGMIDYSDNSKDDLAASYGS